MPQRRGGRHVACPGMIEQNHQAQILGVKSWGLIGLICGAVAHMTCPPEVQPPMALMVVGIVQPQGRRMGSDSATSAPLNTCIHETSFCSRTTVGKKRPCMKWNSCKTDTPLSRISVGGRWQCVNTFVLKSGPDQIAFSFWVVAGEANLSATTRLIRLQKQTNRFQTDCTQILIFPLSLTVAPSLELFQICICTLHAFLFCSLWCIAFLAASCFIRYVVDTLTAKRGIKVAVFGPDGLV